MISRIFLALTDYPVFRRLLWKPIYEFLAKRFKSKEWCFMNYGYAPAEQAMQPLLHDEDEVNRYPIQLYHCLATKTNLEGLDVLEVGSGRGGGAAYLKKYFKLKTITGIDIANNAVMIANEYFATEGIGFVQGSAEQLPFSDGTFDVVINVESSHTYGSVPMFLMEVRRVLRNSGYLLLADIRTAHDVELLKQQIYSCGLTVLAEENISANVSRAIELEEPIKQQRIAEHVPERWQAIFRQFAGVKGSQAHLQLQNGKLVYTLFVLKKFDG
jgi:ubiquinone/menaquinone biosynthesis C-methylase UbiE